MRSWKSLYWLLLVSGILVIVVGLSMLFAPLASVVGLAIYIGISMLFSGISEIAGYVSEEKGKRSAWLLTSGILSSLLGVWTLFGKGSAVLSIALPFVFAIWVMSSGIMRIVGSFSLKALGSKMWGWLLVLGILGAFLGFLLMFSPLLSAMIVAYLIAFMCIAHGINSLVLFWGMRKLAQGVK